MSTVPIFAPDGTLGDIPADQLAAAVKAGAKPGVHLVGPDGSKGVVPADRYVDAVKAGAKVAPFEDQEIKHPGFWSALSDDFKSMFSSPNQEHWQSGRAGAATQLNEQQKQQSSSEDEARQATGRSGGYRAIAPLAEGVSNVQGEEKSANEGDIGGVLGHAALTPLMMAISEGLARGIPPVAKASAPAIRATAKGVNTVLEKAPATVGAGIGAGLGAASHVPYGAEVGAGIGTVVGRELLPKLRVPGENFGSPAAVYPGANLPAVPSPALLQARALEHGGAAAPPEASAALGGLPVAPTPPRPLPAGFQPAAAPYREPIGTAGNPLPVESAPETSPVAPTPPEAQPTVPRGIDRAPQPVSGESALTQILGGQDSANLLKIAKSRGINVTRESQLRPGLANQLLINKIIDDFSPDELQEVSAQYMESKLHGHHKFGEIGPEAWKTMSLQTYFPDVKIAGATIKRTQAAISKAAPKPLLVQADEDLTGILQQSLAAAQKKGSQ